MASESSCLYLGVLSLPCVLDRMERDFVKEVVVILWFNQIYNVGESGRARVFSGKKNRGEKRYVELKCDEFPGRIKVIDHQVTPVVGITWNVR